MSHPFRKPATVARMAAVMLDIRATGRVVDEDALANEGFTGAEIAAFARRARDIANARAVRQVA